MAGRRKATKCDNRNLDARDPDVDVAIVGAWRLNRIEGSAPAAELDLSGRPREIPSCTCRAPSWLAPRPSASGAATVRYYRPTFTDEGGPFCGRTKLTQPVETQPIESTRNVRSTRAVVPSQNYDDVATHLGGARWAGSCWCLQLCWRSRARLT